MGAGANGTFTTAWILGANLIDAGIASLDERCTGTAIPMRTGARGIQIAALRVFRANFSHARMTIVGQCHALGAIIVRA